MASTNETALEQTFSELAYSRLRDRAQGMLDYLVGFQLLKQHDDGERAVGIFGCEVDDDYYYIPAFFLHGEIRGLDSIYSVSSDLFLPLVDGWVDTIINRRQPTLGESNGQPKRDFGARVPEYNRLRDVPSGAQSINLKLASDISTSMMGDRQSGDQPDLVSVIAGTPMAGMFKRALDNSPTLRKAFSSFGYDYLDLVEPLQKTAAEEKKVVIVSQITDPDAPSLTDEEKQRVLEGGAVVLDTRPEISKAKAYDLQGPMALENPTGGGLYDVLWADGTISQAFLSSTGDQRNTYLLIRDEDKHYGLVKGPSVYVLRKYSDAECREWLDKNGRLPSGVPANRVVAFISNDGEGTPAYCVDEKTIGLDGITSFRVHTHYMSGPCPPCGWQHDGRVPHNAFMDVQAPYNYRSSRTRDPGCAVSTVLVTDTGRPCPVFNDEKLIVNDKHFWALDINSFTERKDDEAQDSPIDSTEEVYKRHDVVLSEKDLGDPSTVCAVLEKVATDLQVWRQGTEVLAKTASACYSFRNEGQALDTLIGELGLGEDDARAIYNGATINSHQFKVAAFLEMPEITDESEGGLMGEGFTQMTPFQTSTQVPSEDENREVYEYGGMDGGVSSLQVAEQAAQTGRKDVFDAAALASMIKSHKPDQLVERFMPIIQSGMDRLGRMLFLIYWHYDDFEERYGEDELQELLDNLSNVFEQLGDVVLFVKEKSLAGNPDFFGLPEK